MKARVWDIVCGFHAQSAFHQPVFKVKEGDKSHTLPVFGTVFCEQLFAHQLCVRLALLAYGIRRLDERHIQT